MQLAKVEREKQQEMEQVCVCVCWKKNEQRLVRMRVCVIFLLLEETAH